MSEPFIRYSFHNEAIAALAQIEEKIAAVRLMIETGGAQDALALQMLAAWANLSERQRHRFCDEHGLVRTPASNGEAVATSPYHPSDKGKIERALGLARRSIAAAEDEE